MSNYGLLRDYIEKVTSKELQRVDVDPERSNQHEIGGVTKAMLPVLGDTDRKASDGNGIPTVTMYLSDDDDPVTEDIYTSNHLLTNMLAYDVISSIIGPC